MTDATEVEKLVEELQHPSVTSALSFLRMKYQRARCDNEAVADCVRCQTMFLVATVESILAATEQSK